MEVKCLQIFDLSNSFICFCGCVQRWFCVRSSIALVYRRLLHTSWTDEPWWECTAVLFSRLPWRPRTDPQRLGRNWTGRDTFGPPVVHRTAPDSRTQDRRARAKTRDRRPTPRCRRERSSTSPLRLHLRFCTTSGPYPSPTIHLPASQEWVSTKRPGPFL